MNINGNWLRHNTSRFESFMVIFQVKIVSNQTIRIVYRMITNIDKECCEFLFKYDQLCV
jgi:hypothetical protein